jgi:hypothetical protein
MGLLRGEKVAANGGEGIGPPVPGGDEQQDRNKDRVRREKKRNLAVRETKRPGNLRGQIVAGATEQNPKRSTGKGARLFLGLGSNRVDTLHFNCKSSLGRLAAPSCECQLVGTPRCGVRSGTLLCETKRSSACDCRGQSDGAARRPYHNHDITKASSGTPSHSAAAERSVKSETSSGEWSVSMACSFA